MAKVQPTSRKELEALLALVDRDREQSNSAGLFLDGRFSFLYNVALQLATIVLRLHGLRISAEGHHRETLRTVAGIVPPKYATEIGRFERARRKRNTLTYDRAGVVTEADVVSLREAIDAFESWVREQVRAHTDAMRE